MSKTSVEILEQLVSFPVLGGESNLSILQWITDYLEQHQQAYQLVPNEEGTKASVHCRIGPPVDGGTILSGHMDVVPTEGQPWKTDPFKLSLDGDLLYARGSCDMKGFLACCLAGLPRWQGAALKRPIYFAFSYDEEIGCMAGPALAKDINDHYSERPRFAIIGEPSMLQPIVGQKGINVYRTRITGSQGHSSRVNTEVSAVHEAARLIVWLEDNMQQLIQAGRIDDRFSPNHTSLHAGVIHGGTAFNIIANECWFDWDYRNIPSDRADQIIRDFQAYCDSRSAILTKRYAQFKIENIEKHPPVPALDTPADAQVVSLIKALSGNDQLGTVSFASEAGQFMEAGFESVICGPGSIEQAHRANEFVAVEQLEQCSAMLDRLVQRQQNH